MTLLFVQSFNPARTYQIRVANDVVILSRSIEILAQMSNDINNNKRLELLLPSAVERDLNQILQSRNSLPLLHILSPANLSIGEAADLLQVSRLTLSKIVNERGAITPNIAKRISKAFGGKADFGSGCNVDMTFVKQSSERADRPSIFLLMDSSLVSLHLLLLELPPPSRINNDHAGLSFYKTSNQP